MFDLNLSSQFIKGHRSEFTNKGENASFGSNSSQDHRSRLRVGSSRVCKLAPGLPADRLAVVVG